MSVNPEEVGKKHPTRWGGRQKYYMTSQQRQIILDMYDGRTGTLDRIMRYFPGIPRHKVRMWARELGRARPPRQPWTEEENTYLRNNLHRMTTTALAHKLGRSRTAIQRHIEVLSITRRAHIHGYTVEQLATGLAVSRTTVMRWVNNGWIQAAKLHTERSHDALVFKDQYIRQFIFAHPGAVDPRKFDWLWLCSILKG